MSNNNTQYDVFYGEIKTHYDQFQEIYNNQSDFQKIYCNISPFIEVYPSDKVHFKNLLQKLGYSQYIFSLPKIDSLINLNACNSCIGVDSGWFYDYIYFIFKTSGQQFILCHYHRKESKYWSKLFLSSIVIGSTVYYFNENITNNLNNVINNQQFIVKFYNFLSYVSEKLKFDDIKSLIENFKLQQKEENKKQDLIYACVIYKAFQFLITNQEFFRNRLYINHNN